MNKPCTSQELIADYWFGAIADKRKPLKDEADEPRTGEDRRFLSRKRRTAVAKACFAMAA